MEWLHSALEGCPASKRQRHQSHSSSSICTLQAKQHQVLRCVDSIPCSFQKAIQGAALAVCREVDPDDLREAIDRLLRRIKLQFLDETISYLVDEGGPREVGAERESFCWSNRLWCNQSFLKQVCVHARQQYDEGASVLVSTRDQKCLLSLERFTPTSRC